MRRLLLSLVVALAATGAAAQDDLYFGNKAAQAALAVDSVPQAGCVAAAGRLLRKSATFDYAAVATAVTGCIVAGVGAGKDEIDKARPYYWAAVGFGVAALAFRVAAIHFKGKSGAKLELAAGGARLTF